jgi:hypothetical protein
LQTQRSRRVRSILDTPGLREGFASDRHVRLSGRAPLRRGHACRLRDSLVFAVFQVCRSCSLVLWPSWSGRWPAMTAPALRRSLLLWRHHSLSLHRADVRTVSYILTESANRAGQLGETSVTLNSCRGRCGETNISMLSSQWDNGNEAEGEPVPRLDRMRGPIAAVMTLRCDAFVALKRTCEVCRIVSQYCGRLGRVALVTFSADDEEERHVAENVKLRFQ